MAKIAVTCLQMQDDLDRHRDRIQEAGYELVVPTLLGQRFESDDLVRVAAGCIGLIAGDDDLGRRSLERLPDLRVLVRWGIGTDTVDFAAAEDCGIVVRNTPGVFGEEVADSAFGYVLNIARGHHKIDAAVRRGEWLKIQGTSLHDQVLGVVGAGSIGRAVMRRGIGFGMRVLTHDPFLAEELPSGVEQVDLQRLLTESRFVILTAPATADTRGMINAETLSQMRPDAYLVNVARGELVVERDLVAALRDGGLAGAGLDVFEVEPLPADSELRELNVVLGSHNGSNTRQGVERASQRAVDIMLEELARLKPVTR
jgi:D-3-phosphoglycerate dehydrogenase / 2-oxoglutarate reductase